jgi:hypothetical protein
MPDENLIMDAPATPVAAQIPSAAAPAAVADNPRFTESFAREIPEQNAADLRDGLIDRDIHPIVVYGVESAGKTALLQSIIYYGTHGLDGDGDAAMGFRLDEIEKVFPPDYPNGVLRNQRAHLFYVDHLLTDRRQGCYPQHTQALDQYFIAAELTPDSPDLPRQGFAFLEGSGALFAKKSAAEIVSGVRDFPESTPLVRDLLENFKHPLSVLLVAPAQMGDGRSGRESAELDRQESIDCLSAGLGRYLTERPDKLKALDNICLIAGKWDVRYREETGVGANRVVRFPRIGQTSYRDVLKVVKEWQPLWTNFATLLDYPGGRALLPFSAGPDVNGQIVLNHPDAKLFRVFNRTLWNWLYANATAKVIPGMPPARQTLCPDTQAIRKRHQKPWDRYFFLPPIDKKLLKD